MHYMKVNGGSTMGGVKGRSLIVALTVTIAALVVSSAAYATGSAQHTYGGGGANVQSEVQSGAQGGGQAGAKDPRGVGTAAAKAPSSLPFTGLDLTLMLGGGLILIASGVALGRLAIRGSRV
jgi:hypothetical protein